MPVPEMDAPFGPQRTNGVGLSADEPNLADEDVLQRLIPRRRSEDKVAPSCADPHRPKIHAPPPLRVRRRGNGLGIERDGYPFTGARHPPDGDIPSALQHGMICKHP